MDDSGLGLQVTALLGRMPAGIASPRSAEPGAGRAGKIAPAGIAGPADAGSQPTAPGQAAASDGRSALPSGGARDARLRDAATKFEAAFLAEMLRHAGLGKPRETFGGGAGEQAFANSLVQEYAGRIARAGGVGLAESIYKALLAREAK